VVNHLGGLNTHPVHPQRGRKVNYRIGFDLDEQARTAITVLLATVWEPALDTVGQLRDDAHLALPGLLRHSHAGELRSWPAGMRIIASHSVRCSLVVASIWPRSPCVVMVFDDDPVIRPRTHVDDETHLKCSRSGARAAREKCSRNLGPASASNVAEMAGKL